jgi:antitoxin VapB
MKAEGQRAKLFKNGASQAVRLPKAFRFIGADEVLVHREGRKVVLEPVDTWSPRFLKALGGWAEDIPRPVAPLVRVDNPFDR